ncbi:unnamed protein product [Arabidopsis lyrata]|nr:unnamed protein product [Arabidopsis lyrata]
MTSYSPERYLLFLSRRRWVAEEQETKTEYSSFVPEVVAGKFGSLVLNALPKGNRPGSGPSKKTNDVKT